MRKATPISQASLLRKSILQAAVQGKLVPQDESDEPASVLLARIKAEKAQLIKEGKLKKEKVLSPVSEEEKPFGLPVGWEWVRLGDVGFAQTGNTPPTSNKENYGEEFVFVSPGDLTENSINYVKKLSNSGYLKARRIKKNSIIMVCIGGSIGKCTLIDRDIACNQQINTITLYGGEPKYILYALRSSYFLERLHNIHGGTATPIVNKSAWCNIIIPLPPLAEQERIVAKVNELMHQCDQLEQAEQAALALDAHFFDTLPKSILQAAVQGKLVPQDEGDEPASVLLERIKAEKAKLIKDGKLKKEKALPLITEEEKPFDLPQGWEWVRLGEIAFSIATGPFGSMLHKYDYIQNGIPLVNPINMHNGGIVSSSKMMVSEETKERLKNYALYTNDIVIARRGDLGRCAIVTDKEHGWLCGTGSFILRLTSAMSLRYYMLFFKSPFSLKQLLGNSVGATMNNLNHTILGKLCIPLPPLAEQKRIVAKLAELMRMAMR